MKQIIEKMSFKTVEKQIIEITDEISQPIGNLQLNSGLINLSILHTSCSLMVQENADNTVLTDIKNYLNEIVR